MVEHSVGTRRFAFVVGIALKESFLDPFCWHDFSSESFSYVRYIPGTPQTN